MSNRKRRRLPKYHIGTRQQSQIRDLVASYDPRHVLVVAIDASKFFHRVLITDRTGRVLRQPFSMDIYAAGFEQFASEVAQAATANEAQLTLVGVESTGHYHENLVWHIQKLLECTVLLVNPFSTNEMRNLNLNYVKTDDCDLDAIAELVIHCKASQANLPQGIYLRLRELARWRSAKVEARASLKQQIHGHMDRIWPGITNGHEEQKGFVKSFWCKTVCFLIECCPTPQQATELGAAGLRKLATERSLRLSKKLAAKIVAHAGGALCPDPKVVEARLQILAYDMAQLNVMEAAITEVESQMEEMLGQCSGRVLTSIGGVGVITAAEVAGELGEPACYTHSAAAGKLAGLNPGTYQTGIQSPESNKITKFGRPLLRQTAVDAARRLIKREPYFASFYDRLVSEGKHKMVALCAVARKFLCVCLAMMQSGSEFNPPTRKKTRNLPEKRDPLSTQRKTGRAALAQT